MFKNMGKNCCLSDDGSEYDWYMARCGSSKACQALCLRLGVKCRGIEYGEWGAVGLLNVDHGFVVSKRFDTSITGAKFTGGNGHGPVRSVDQTGCHVRATCYAKITVTTGALRT